MMPAVRRRLVLFLLVSVGCLQLLVLNGFSKYRTCDLDVKSLNGGDNSQSHFKDALVFPVPPREKAFLTIGIPTVKRKDASYIQDTISSLLLNMSPEETEEVVFVMLLADRDPDLRRNLADEIIANFNDSITNGTLNVIQAPDSYYPDFSKISKFTYEESKQHVHWRAKQCYDYAYMMEYSTDLSTYYMQLEDDVVASAGYIQSIKEFMEQQPDNFWVCLEFSELGFIGKLYRSSDLRQLADLIKLFYIEQPVDYTYVYFNVLSLQVSQRLKKPTLFQHKGLQSSLSGKVQRLRDRFYYGKAKTDGRDNPLAFVVFSGKHYQTYAPHLAYDKLSYGYFWTNGPPRVGSTLTVIFQKPQQLHRVVVETGTSLHPHDILHRGVLLAGFLLTKDKKTRCSDTVLVGEFENGRIDVNNLEENVKEKVACLVIKVAKSQTDWLIIRDIIVTLSESTHTTISL